MAGAKSVEWRLANMQCDCEHESSGIVCGHRPGACKNTPTRKVRLFGLGMNICDHCFEMQHTTGPVAEKLDFDWYIPVDADRDRGADKLDGDVLADILSQLPVLGEAAKYLKAFMDEVNAHSDGCGKQVMPEAAKPAAVKWDGLSEGNNLVTALQLIRELCGCTEMNMDDMEQTTLDSLFRAQAFIFHADSHGVKF